MHIVLQACAFTVACCCICMLSYIAYTCSIVRPVSLFQLVMLVPMFIWLCLCIVTAPIDVINATAAPITIAKAPVVLISHYIVCKGLYSAVACASFSYHTHKTRCNLSYHNLSLGIYIFPSQLLNYSEAMLLPYQLKWLLLLWTLPLYCTRTISVLALRFSTL